MVKTPQFIAATLVCIKMLPLRHDKLSKRFTYGDESDMPHSVGDEIPLCGADRRYPEAVSRHISTGMQQRERADTEGCGKQRPCPHACGVSAVNKCKYAGEEAEREDVTASTGGVSDAAEALLGSALLGDRVWCVEHGRDNRQDGTGLS